LALAGLLLEEILDLFFIQEFLFLDFEKVPTGLNSFVLKT